MAIVGDVTVAEVKRLAERYFGPMAAKPMPPVVTTEEPPQAGPKTVVVEMAGPPATVVGYKRPSQYDKDDIALDLIQILLSQGRTGILYNELVREKRLAQQAQAIATHPDGRYPNLFVFLLVPAQGHTVEENQRALEELLQRFKTTTLDPQLLARAKAQGRANLIRRMTNNGELAGLLALHARQLRRLAQAVHHTGRSGSGESGGCAAGGKPLLGGHRPHDGIYGAARHNPASPAAGAQDGRPAMRALAGILLLASCCLCAGCRRSRSEDGQAGSAPPRRYAGRGASRAGEAAPPRGHSIAPKDLKYPPLRTIQMPAAAIFTLPNGMRIYLLEDHDLPLVSGIALIRTGRLLDPPQRIGLAQLAGITMRTGGTTSQDRGTDRRLTGQCRRHHGVRDRRFTGRLSFSGIEGERPGHTPTIQGNAHPAGFPPGQDRTRKVPIARCRVAAQ